MHWRCKPHFDWSDKNSKCRYKGLVRARNDSDEATRMDFFIQGGIHCEGYKAIAQGLVLAKEMVNRLVWLMPWQVFEFEKKRKLDGERNLWRTLRGATVLVRQLHCLIQISQMTLGNESEDDFERDIWIIIQPIVSALHTCSPVDVTN